MNGVARQDRGKAALIEHGYRRSAAAPRRACGGDKSGCFLLLAGEGNETGAGPLPGGGGGRHGVPAIEPNPGAGGLAGGFSHAHLLHLVKTGVSARAGFGPAAYRRARIDKVKRTSYEARSAAPGGTRSGGVAERLKAADCKSADVCLRRFESYPLHQPSGTAAGSKARCKVWEGRFKRV